MDARLTFLMAVAALFAILLAALVVALIVSGKFRDAVLGGPGEATVLGVLTVKGAAIVLLCALFVGGISYTLAETHNSIGPAGPKGEKGDPGPQGQKGDLDQKAINDILKDQLHDYIKRSDIEPRLKAAEVKIEKSEVEYFIVPDSQMTRGKLCVDRNLECLAEAHKFCDARGYKGAVPVEWVNGQTHIVCFGRK